MRNLILTLLILALAIGCIQTNKKPRQINKTEPYTFFVAGHVYGKAGSQNLGMFPSFYEKIKTVQNADFGILTGDAVPTGAKEQWIQLQAELDTLNMPIHLARGNHEYKNEENLDKFFPENYYSFKAGNDLHIILDSQIADWNIEDAQLDFLQNCIDSVDVKTANIFLYVHHVIWHDPLEEDKIKINSKGGRNPISNFKTEILPLFDDISSHVYFIAGDVGAGHWCDDYSYSKPEENIHLITSGMGEGFNDNYLTIETDSFSNVSINVNFFDSTSFNQIENIEVFLK